MSVEFRVDPDGLAGSGRAIEAVAVELGSLRVDEALTQCTSGLPGTATATALEVAALKITAALAAYAAATSAIATHTADSVLNYSVVDDAVVAALRTKVWG